MATQITTDYFGAMGLAYVDDIDEWLDEKGLFIKATFDLKKLEACLEALRKLIEAIDVFADEEYRRKYAVDVYIAKRADKDLSAIIFKPHMIKKGLHIALAGLDLKVLDSDHEDDEEEADA